MKQQQKINDLLTTRMKLVFLERKQEINKHDSK